MHRIVSVCLLLVLFSCSSEPKKAESRYTQEQVNQKKELVKQVMAVHDEAMPWLDKINSLKTEIETKLTTQENDSVKEVCRGSIIELEKADEAMMEWMRGYSEPADTAAFETVVEYLSNEELKISEVKDRMKSSIEKAENLLGK